MGDKKGQDLTSVAAFLDGICRSPRLPAFPARNLRYEAKGT
jgi:hypothetical protein